MLLKLSFYQLLAVLLLLGVANQAQAQFVLSGQVTHQEDGGPVIGAAIYLPDLRLGVTTGPDGKYALRNIPKGTFTVQVSYVSHKSIIEKVSLTANVQKNFVMENSTLSLEEVIVSGASAKTIIKESPIPMTAMNNLQWLQASSTNLVDAVAKLPGMSQISTGVGLSKPVIRGLGFNRVITMHDGIRQEDNQWGEEHSIHVDEFSVDRYEIIRGAGSLMYGSDGLGGVMSLLSPRPLEEGRTVARVLSNYQSNNNMYGLSGMGAGNVRGFTWLARASTRSANNYRNSADGRVFGSNFRENLNVSGMVGLTKKWGYSRLYLARWQQQINIIDGARDAQGRFTQNLALNGRDTVLAVPSGELSSRQINPANSQDLTNWKIASNNLFFIGNGSLSANIGYSQNHRREFDNPLAPPNTPSLYFFLQTLYYDVRYSLPEKKGWETTFGTNGMYQLLNNRGAEVLYPDYNLLDNGVFVFAKKSWAKLKASGGLRYDLRALSINKLYIDGQGRFQTSPQGAVEERFAGFDRNFGNVTGSLGAVYEISPQFSVKANVARGFRAPSVPEISSNGEHAGTFRYEIGNVNQRSEVSLQGDIGLTYETKSVYLDLSLFTNRIDNYSFSERVLARSGQDSLVDGVPAFRYTQGNARLQGIEATFTLNPERARWFNLTQTYSLVLGRNLSASEPGARYLPFMPPPRWNTRLRLSRDKIGTWLRNGYVLVEWEHHQAQNRFLAAYNTETATLAYSLWSVGLGADVVDSKGRTRFSVYFSGQNLADLAYQNHQNRLKYLDVNPRTGQRGVFNMGRNLSLKVVVPLEVRGK